MVFAAGRKPSNVVMEVLGAQAKGFLESRQAVYVADMSRMPGFVTRTFALPALRDQPFAVGVNLDDKQLADWPRQQHCLCAHCGRVEKRTRHCHPLIPRTLDATSRTR